MSKIFWLYPSMQCMHSWMIVNQVHFLLLKTSAYHAFYVKVLLPCLSRRVDMAVVHAQCSSLKFIGTCRLKRKPGVEEIMLAVDRLYTRAGVNELLNDHFQSMRMHSSRSVTLHQGLCQGL